ncbi:MAG: transcriptional regulator PpsR [Paracoccaceae bacterium]|jgi:transcriptional regulator PpsR
MNRDDTKLWDLGSIPMIDPQYLGNILTTASDVAIVLDEHDQIKSVMMNNATPSFGDLSHWQGHDIRKFLTIESVPKLDQALGVVRSGRQIMNSIELNHQDNAKWQFPVRYSIHEMGPDGAIILLGRNLQDLSEIQQQLVDAQIAMEDSHEQRRAFDAHYRMLLASSQDCIVFLSVSDGSVVDLNQAAAQLLDVGAEAARGKKLAQFGGVAARAAMIDKLCDAASHKTSTDLRLEVSGRQVRVTPVLYRVAGQRVLLCRMSPLDQVMAHDGQLESNLVSLYKHGSDGIVFTNANGAIQSANESFLEMINVANFSDIRGASLGDYLSRGQIDLAVMLDNVTRSGQMRVYSTKLTNDFGIKVDVQASISRLDPDQNGYISFVIRDASRTEQRAQASDQTIPLTTRDEIKELVGGASLKEIVAETSDVVEKMCIEVAIELTKNNRAAAAEMLGLSRQSLYVKLRRLGLLSKNDD